MKIRLKGNSLRMRLSRVDLDHLVEDGEILDGTRFGPGPAAFLGYAVRIGAGEAVQAAFGAGGITVEVPAETLAHWRFTDLVTIEAVQPVGDDVLRITLEKDFACLKPRAADEDRDTFANPSPAHTC